MLLSWGGWSGLEPSHISIGQRNKVSPNSVHSCSREKRTKTDPWSLPSEREAEIETRPFLASLGCKRWKYAQNVIIPSKVQTQL